MYIQITTRCNMECEHCMYSCGPVGIDMQMDVFKKAIDIVESRGDHIAIGGGEPTLHPNFWEIIGLTLGADTFDSDLVPFIATNGSVKDIAMKLANIAKRGCMHVALSVDDFHDHISDDVLHAFGYFDQNRRRVYDQPRSSDHDLRELRDVTANVVWAGRAIENSVGVQEGCGCEDLFIAPEGTIYMCGCREVSFGTVWNYEIPQWYEFMGDKCSKNKEDILEAKQTVNEL